jgi:CDP-paratose 2-epimerase
MAKATITGGAGFIGANLAGRLLSEGHDVTVFDNLSRSGTQSNLDWLFAHPESERLRFMKGDLRDFEALKVAMHGAERVYHLAGQVAVTTSVTDPRADFESNALGTFNALEAARLAADDPIFIYSSTNKVYGGMEHVRIVEGETRYEYADFPGGIPESMILDFHSPYGCSKGAGDQYARDYHRIYGLRTVVMRQSAIAGPRQMGVEDQGWMAWFIIAALKNRQITIYGNGKQVRDVLYVDDLLDAYDAAVRRIDVAAGQIFNVGGGPGKTITIWTEFGPILEEMLGREVPVRYSDWRPGDQPVYISDISKAAELLGWAPRVEVRESAERIFAWAKDNLDLLEHL